MKKKLPACGNPDCSVSTGICDRLTFGSGELLSYGYWEFPCYVCARDYELRQFADSRHCEATWPSMTEEDFFELCTEATELNALIASHAIILLNYSEDIRTVVAGISILSNRGLLAYEKFDRNGKYITMLSKLDKVCEKSGWHLTEFPYDDTK